MGRGRLPSKPVRERMPIYPARDGLVPQRCRHRVLARCAGVVVALAAFPGFQAGAAITKVEGGYLFSGNSTGVLISDTDGSIVSMTAGGGPVATGGGAGLWSVAFSGNSTLNASTFSSNSSSNTFNATLSGDHLLLTYNSANITVAVTLADRADGLDISAAVTPKVGAVMGLTLPAQLRFDPSGLQRFIAPNHSSDGVGMAYNKTYFQVQTEISPASWNQVAQADPGWGYRSLYGAGLDWSKGSDPVAVSFTTNGTSWLGSSLSGKWSAETAVVNRPPAAGQADVVLLDSVNGAIFSGSHLGNGIGAGWLMRIGGTVDRDRVEFSLDIVTAAIEHLAQTSTRTKVGILSMVRGPVIGYNWPSSVRLDEWLARLNNSAALAAKGITIVELSNVQEMADALGAADYLAILNPYGELVPASLAGGIPATVGAIGTFVRTGGNWFEVGGHPFFTALQPELYYTNSLPYPPAFADFQQVETANGNAAVFGVQPAPADPWSTDPATLFVPGQLDWGGDAQGGFCERGFGTYVTANQTWQSPVARISIGHSAADSLQAYSQANGFSRTLADKMPSDVLAKFKQSVLIRHLGNCAQLTDQLSKLPSPSVLHFTQYLHGGFDKQYPDHLPPNAAFGTESDFQNFLAQARSQGILTMPYTNPTFWGENPRGPTYQASLDNGHEPRVLNLDGTLSYEDYFGNGGYTATPWHPDVQSANRSTATQFTSTYPVDMLFEDQVGARSWQYDTNAASPSPTAYVAGLAAIAAEDSRKLPVSTENGFDRLVNSESQFCGLAWGLAPTINAPVWRRFLRDRYAPSTWQIFPMAQYIAHDKLAMNYNDLSAPVTTDETVSWTLGLGYGMTYYLNPTDINQEPTRQWLLWIDRLQKSVCARYTGMAVNSFSHQWGTGTLDDNGVIWAGYGTVNIVSNLGPQALASNGTLIAPYGFHASAPGMVAAELIPPGGSSAVSSVAETNNGGGIDFWIYSKGNQTASVALPSGFNGPATVQMDGSPSSQTEIQGNAVTVALGSTANATTSYLWHGNLVVPSFGYMASSNSTATINGYTGPGGAVTVPGTIAGLTVTGIGTAAFQGRGLTAVTIPGTVTSIGAYAFNGNAGLTSVTIPNSVTSIGDYAFYGCPVLTNIALGTSVASIGTAAFQGCGLTSVTIPNSVTSIGDYAFYGCSSLANVVLGNGVTSIGSGAFQACPALTSVKIPKSVTSIGIWAFSNCTGLTSVYLLGNAPAADPSTFASDSSLTIFYLPGTTGWTNPWNGQAPVCWNPTATNPGFVSNQFGFDITGPGNLTVLVESCPDLATHVWTPAGTVTLSANGTATFRDPQAWNSRARFYRFRAP